MIISQIACIAKIDYVNINFFLSIFDVEDRR